MNISIQRSASSSMIVLAALLGSQAAYATNIGKPEYVANKARIGDVYKADKTACKSLTANAKDICFEEAKAKDKLALAELEYSYTGKRKDRDNIVSVKADGTYAVSKERCDDKAGNDKDVCVKEAKAVKAKVLADLKLSQRVGAARADARDDKRDADYKVAIEKCDALAGDAKSSCVMQAKAMAGKT